MSLDRKVWTGFLAKRLRGRINDAAAAAVVCRKWRRVVMVAPWDCPGARRFWGRLGSVRGGTDAHDGLGEELNVIWELEPGARVIEEIVLTNPTKMQPPGREQPQSRGNDCRGHFAYLNGEREIMSMSSSM